VNGCCWCISDVCGIRHCLFQHGPIFRVSGERLIAGHTNSVAWVKCNIKMFQYLLNEAVCSISCGLQKKKNREVDGEYMKVASGISVVFYSFEQCLNAFKGHPIMYAILLLYAETLIFDNRSISSSLLHWRSHSQRHHSLPRPRRFPHYRLLSHPSCSFSPPSALYTL